MSELSLHYFTAQLLKLNAASGVIAAHIPNGESRSPRTGAKLKRMGVMAGMPDFFLVLPGGRAAFLELKSGKGRLSQSQREIQKQCAANGTPYFVASTPEEVEGCLRAWGAINPLQHRRIAGKEAA